MEKIFNVIDNPHIGLCISSKKSEQISLWIDLYEGGDAYTEDWTFEGYFDNEELAIQYIVNKWGNVIESIDE
jgi:uncharacterized protein YbdZ (MbtH family)